MTRRLKYIISNLKEFDIIVRPGDNSTTKNRTLCIEKVVQSSIPPIHRYDTQDHAQVSSDISIDRVNGIDTRIDTPQIPITENLQIHAQNGSGIDGIDSIDILQGNSIQTEPIQSVEEFFYDGPDLPYKPLPPHTLDQSPCRPIIEGCE